MPPVTDGTTGLDLYVTGFGLYERRPAWYAPVPFADFGVGRDAGDDAWDRQIAADAAKGKLNWLRQEAIDALRSGTVGDL